MHNRRHGQRANIRFRADDNDRLRVSRPIRIAFAVAAFNAAALKEQSNAINGRQVTGQLIWDFVTKKSA
jgi:hypothetical protein